MEGNNTFHSNNNTTQDQPSNHVVLLFIIALVSLIFSIMNILPITIMIRSKRLRKASNYAIISFLLGATIQAMIVAPIYVYKRVETNIRPYWVCDAFRMPYFLASHAMKLSLLIISFDRFCAIRHPFKYDTIFSRKNMVIILCCTWACVLAVDIIPFFTKTIDLEGCTYIPSQVWGISVIVCFNILPFVVIARNYTMLWKVASNMAFKDMKQKVSIGSKEKMMRNRQAVDCENENCKAGQDDNFKFEKPRLLQQYSYVQAVKKGLKKESNVNKPELEEKIANNNEKECHCSSFKGTKKLFRFAFELKATKTSLMLLAVYLVCWGPLGVFYMIDHFCYNCLSDTLKNNDLEAARFFVKILCFMSSPLAPLVYCWRTREFRKEAMKIYCHESYKKKRRDANSRTSMAHSQYSMNPINSKSKISLVKGKH